MDIRLEDLSKSVGVIELSAENTILHSFNEGAVDAQHIAPLHADVVLALINFIFKR